MKAYNNPTDVLTIYNNDGKLLAKVGPDGVEIDESMQVSIGESKYTGAEIDAAVAKADTIPTVSEEDVGKALVVDEEGKIVA